MATETRGLLARIVDGLIAIVDFFLNLIRNVFGPPPATTVIKSRFKQEALRAEDLVVLQFEFINMDLKREQDAEGRNVAHLIPSTDAFIVVRFPPQNIAEQAFFQTDDSYPVKPPEKFPKNPPATDIDEGKPPEEPTPPPVQSLLAHPSRLVFKVPQDTPPIPYNLESLLELCAQSRLSVTGTALPPPADRRAVTRFNARIMRDTFIVPPKETPNISGRVAVSSAQKLITDARARMREQTATPARIAAESLIRIERVETIKPSLRPPTALETSIELPFRLIISPNRYGAFAHAKHLVESPLTKRVELWHTRLASVVDGKVNELNEWYRTIRAIWARDNTFDPNETKRLYTAQADAEDKPFRASLDYLDRHNIVHLTANYHIWITDSSGLRRRYEPLPVNVRRLMLSSLGGWLDSRGAWLPPLDSGLGVEEWRHIAAMGRDHYVRVVYKGYLFPFMHRASLVKITERKFHTDKSGHPAYLRQRMFILVREPEKLYPPTGLRTPAPDDKSYDLQWPISRVRLTTLVTPNLDPPENTDYVLDIDPAVPGAETTTIQALFWPRVGGSDFQFHLIAEDFDGQQVEFTMPLLFASVLGNVAREENIMKLVREDYETNPANESRRTRSMSGKHLMFAPSAKSGDTTYETQYVTFGAEIPHKGVTGDQINSLGEDAPRFYPAVRSAVVIPPALKALAGVNQTIHIRYADTYLKDGFGGPNNPGEVFAEIIPGTTPIALNFNGQGDKSGGLVMPNMSIKGFSRLLGPVAGDDLKQLTQGTFNPADFFKGLNAKIFGAIDLWNVIQQVNGFGGKTDLVPKFIAESFTAVQAFLQELSNFKQRLNRISAELVSKGGAVATLPARLQTDYDNLKNQIEAVINNPPADATAWKNAFVAQLNTFNADLQELKAALALLPSFMTDDVRALQLIITNFADELQSAAKTAAYVGKLLGAMQVPEELKVRFEWKPALKDWPPASGSAKPLFIARNSGKDASLTIAVEASAKTNLASAPKANVSCLLQNFTVDLIGNIESFIRIRFTKLEFRATTGMKPDVDVVLDGIEFVGVLSFVEVLRNLIPLDGFSDPPALNVTSEGIDASFSMALPNIAFGVFSLQNLSLGAGFNLPFVGKPMSVRFNFCERQSPFLLTVAFFGGGGFFGITVDPAGVQILEASFEFGASISVDFGVASGGVYVMAGIYFRMEKNEAGQMVASLTGYLRMGGQVKALGIVSVSIELYLSLKYEFSSGKCTGRAVLTLSVKIAFFSVSIKIECERKFAGSNGDPTFKQLMEPYRDPRTHEIVDPWREYCQAFA